jgi:hypothetical protein
MSNTFIQKQNLEWTKADTYSYYKMLLDNDLLYLAGRNIINIYNINT